MAMQYSFECFLLNNGDDGGAVNGESLRWGEIGGKILYLVPNSDKDGADFCQLSNLGWIVVVFGKF